jgi:integrase
MAKESSKKRRLHGEGTLWRDPRNGHWRFRSKLTLPDGSVVTINASAPTQKEARAKFNQKKKDLLNQGRKARAKGTLRDHAEWWLETRRTQIKARTFQGYRNILNTYVYPAFGGRRVQDIQTAEWLDFLHVYSKRGHVSTAQHILSVVKALCSYLVRSQRIDVNRLSTITARDFTQARKLDADGNAETGYPIWTKQEARAFLEAAVAFDEFPVFVILLFCGLRLGEVQALRWDDFSPGFATVKIRRSYSTAEPNLITTPKTAKSVRTLHLGETAQRAMEAAYEAYLTARRAPNYNDQGYTFTRNGGKLIRQEYLRTVRDRIVAAANEEQARRGTGLEVRRLRIQDMRAFFATTVTEKTNPMLAQAATGHANMRTTADYYLHQNPDDLSRAALDLEDLD